MGTIKTPQNWSPQPIGYGNETLLSIQAASHLVDQNGNRITDQSGNELVTGINIPQAKIPITWGDTSV